MNQRELFVAKAAELADRKDQREVRWEILNTYNEIKPLPVGYKLGKNDAWCAATVSAIGQMLGMTDVVLPECSCPRMVKLYQAKGQWMENDAYKPKPGDIVMYDWQDSGVGDNLGNPDHVGIVETVRGNEIIVIEGNMSNRMGRRSLTVNGKNIRGYCLPKFRNEAEDPNREAVQKRFGFNDATMDYLEAYKFGRDLLRKLATRG